MIELVSDENEITGKFQILLDNPYLLKGSKVDVEILLPFLIFGFVRNGSAVFLGW